MKTNGRPVLSGTEPVIILRAPRKVMEDVKELGCYVGNSGDGESGLDIRLMEMFSGSFTGKFSVKEKLKKWIHTMQRETLSMSDFSICTIWHPDVTVKMVEAIVKGPVFEIHAEMASQVSTYINRHIKKGAFSRIPVVILRSPRIVMQALRSEGFHSGTRKDMITGEFVSLAQLFNNCDDATTLRSELGSIILKLHRESNFYSNGIATLWHPRIQMDMIGDKFSPVEIVAETAEEAKAKLVASRSI